MCQNRWFSCSTTRERPKLRLFCFPHAGGQAATYHRWTPYLPASVELIALKLPGRGDRLQEKPYENLRQLADTLVTVMQPLLAQPFALFGHSMGAAISYRCTLRLRTASLPAPLALFVSACRPPSMWGTTERLHELPESEMIDRLVDRYGRQTTSDDEIEMMRYMAKTIRADLKMMETYRHVDEPPLESPVLALGGVDDPMVTRANLQAWRGMTNSTFGLKLFPGGHFYFRSQEQVFVQTVLSRLRDY